MKNSGKALGSHNSILSGDIASRILFVLFVLIVYRLGTYIPLPGVNTLLLDELNNAHSGGMLAMFNMLTGGALGRLSIFALNIMPFITASIVMQLLSVTSSELAALKNEGEAGRKKLNQYTRYLTVLLAMVQGYGIAVGVESMTVSGGAIVENPGIIFRLSSTFSLLAGTMLVMWFAEQINVKGIGNGSSLIIFSGIVAGLPSALVTLFEMSRTGALSAFNVIMICAVVMILVSAIVYVERAQRRIAVSYPKRQVGNRMYGGDTTHIPLKINTSGVVPAIFASALLLFPTTIIGFTGSDSEVGQFFLMHFSHGKFLYIMLYALLITFFCFFYTSVIFNPENTADTLKRNGGVILGRRPGAHTAEYLDFVLTRLTVLGSVYMVFICVFPEVLIYYYSIPFYLGGTSLLIVVNVVLDFITQIQTSMLSNQYENLMKKMKVKVAR